MQEISCIINLKPGRTRIFWGRIFTTWQQKNKEHHSYQGKNSELTIIGQYVSLQQVTKI
jgi:hypothetical protein